IPTGKIIARPMVVRACGHEQEFQHFAVDKYRQQRLAAFQASRCADCVAKLQKQEQVAAQSIPKKGEVLQALPVGTQVSMTLTEDGAWTGRLAADGIEVDGVGTDGPRGLIITLARKWLAARG